MRWAHGPRPRAIRWFAAVFLLSALLSFAHSMSHVGQHVAYLAERMPGWHIGRDEAIVMLSARLSIAFIPVALVWLFASRVARWLVTAMALARLVNVPELVTILGHGGQVSLLWLGGTILPLVAAGLLFSAGGAAWFARDNPDVTAFH